MIEEKVKVKYKGVYQIRVQAPGFIGTVNPGDVIEVFKSVYDSELKSHLEWEMVKKSKEEKEGAK